MKIFGILSNSLPTGITGAVVETADLSSSVTVKTLTGNPPTTTVDIRKGEITQKLKVTCEFDAVPDAAAIRVLLADTATSTVTITSLDTVALTLVGTIIDFNVGAKKDDYWPGDFTIQYVDAVTPPV